MGALDGKVAIVTGAARGQGAAEATLFAREGASVVLTDVLAEGADVAAAIGAPASFVRHDVGSEAGWEEVVGHTMDRHGRLDVLVNNAAILHLASLEDTSVADYERVFRVNQLGPFLGMRAAVAPMRASGGGAIVNVSSVDGIFGMNGVVAYAATKFALRGMTRVAALELGKHGIRVNCLHPGGVDTPMGAPPEATATDKDAFFAHHPIARIGQPQEIAQVALFLASAQSSYVTGSELVADGGQIAGARVVGVPGY